MIRIAVDVYGGDNAPDCVLDGALDLLVEPLLLADREEKLKRQSEA